MSMLAAPRRKQKWTLNPRGKQWSEDSNKFGQKMLEKMGWSSGKGLGAKQQGIVEHVKVKVKNDQVGIGYKKDKDDQWTEHQDDFNNFLQNLQKETFTKVPEDAIENDIALSGKSLEVRSKLSQKRVHYQKFTRGKDVNKYSHKDLANIFGKKNFNEKPEKEVVEEVDAQIYDPVGTKDTTAGILTIKGGTINEYFSKKFVTSEVKQYYKDQEKSESESEIRAGFGFSQKSKSTFYVNGDANVEKENSGSDDNKYKSIGFVKSSESKVKSKKLNNLNYVFDNPCLDLNILNNSFSKEEKSNDELLKYVTPKKRKNEDLDSEASDKPNLKKQKKEFTYNNEGFDLVCSDNSSIVTNEIEIISEKSESKKSKKNKKPKESNQYENQGLHLEYPDNSVINRENIEIPSMKDIENFNGVTPKKSKKSKKLEVAFNGIENPGLDLNFPDKLTLKKSKKNKDIENTGGIENPGLDLEFPDKLTPKKSKKNKDIEITGGIENPGLDLEFPDKLTPKKSKKNKDIEITGGIENPGLDLNFPDKLTPKKSKKNKDIENTGGIENAGLDLEFPDKLTPKKSKKNKDIENTGGIENPGLDLEFPDKLTPKKSKKNKDIENTGGIENPGLDLEFPDKLTPKKSKKNKDIENTGGIENLGLDLEFLEKSSQKKSKKNEIKISLNGIENSALDLNYPDNLTSKRKMDIEVVSIGIENPGLDLKFPDKPTPKKQKKNKKDKNSSGLENPALDLNCSENEIQSTNDFEVPRTYGVENNALNLSDEDKHKKRVTFNDEIEYSTDSVNKKKKKLDKYEVVNEKVKKKKSKGPVTFVNEALDVFEVVNLEETDNEDNEINEKKSLKDGKRRERRISLLETIEEISEEENSNGVLSVDESQDNDGDIEIVAEFQCDDVQEVPYEESEKKKSKKKKKKNKERVKNKSSDIEESNVKVKNIDQIDLTENIVTKKNKKKNKKDEVVSSAEVQTNSAEDSGKENICSELENVDGKKKKIKSDQDVMNLKEFLNEENVEEKKTKSQKQSAELEIVATENVQKDETFQRTKFSNFQRTKSFKRQQPKHIIKALFLKNPILLFNGSNINEIKGYGSNIDR